MRPPAIELPPVEDARDHENARRDENALPVATIIHAKDLIQLSVGASGHEAAENAQRTTDLGAIAVKRTAKQQQPVGTPSPSNGWSPTTCSLMMSSAAGGTTLPSYQSELLQQLTEFPSDQRSEGTGISTQPTATKEKQAGKSHRRSNRPPPASSFTSVVSFGPMAISSSNKPEPLAAAMDGDALEKADFLYSSTFSTTMPRSIGDGTEGHWQPVALDALPWVTEEFEDES